MRTKYSKEICYCVKNNALEFISALNNIRWNGEKSNYNEINLFNNLFNDEDKILIHWLTYISDRQMPFEKVWVYGGYVYSHIVWEWKYGKCNEIKNINDIFYKHIKVKDGNDNAEENKQKYKICVNEYDGKNEKLNRENIKIGEPVEFTSRFYSTDLKYIYLTLCILQEDHEKSLFKYIKEFTNSVENQYKMKAIIYALYVLSYKDNKQGKKEQFKEFIDERNNRHFKKEYDVIKNNIEDFKDEPYKTLEKFDNDTKRYNGMKRLWCCIRDYIKAYYYKDYFLNCLMKYNIDINVKDIENFITYIELPGDVWNNNDKFRNCILESNANTNDKKLSQILREEYDMDSKSDRRWIDRGLYPESFDVSFDLASRMCENGKCEFCLMNKTNKANKLCINNKGSLCTLSMIYCGYEFRCCGKSKCPFSTLL